jgi:hypothetical protein
MLIHLNYKSPCISLSQCSQKWNIGRGRQLSPKKMIQGLAQDFSGRPTGFGRVA